VREIEFFDAEVYVACLICLIEEVTASKVYLGGYFELSDYLVYDKGSHSFRFSRNSPGFMGFKEFCLDVLQN